jgi:hypothetical protein
MSCVIRKDISISLFSDEWLMVFTLFYNALDYDALLAFLLVWWWWLALLIVPLLVTFFVAGLFGFRPQLRLRSEHFRTAAESELDWDKFWLSWSWSIEIVILRLMAKRNVVVVLIETSYISLSAFLCSSDNASKLRLELSIPFHGRIFNENNFDQVNRS